MPGATTSTIFYFIYVLESFKDKKRYIGFTTNLRERIIQHNKGLVFSTKPRLPMKLIFFEACLNEEDARRREEYLKTTRGRRFLAKRLKTYYAARCQNAILTSGKSKL